MAVQPFLTPGETANKLRISIRTLERLRQTGMGPRFHKIGTRVVYADSDVTEFMENHSFTSTSQYDDRAAVMPLDGQS